MSDAIPIRADGVVEAEVDGERVLMSPVDFTYYGLADTAGAVWDRIDGHRSLTQLVDELSAEYDAPEDEIRRDVEDLLGHFAAAGLVHSG